MRRLVLPWLTRVVLLVIAFGCAVPASDPVPAPPSKAPPRLTMDETLQRGLDLLALELPRFLEAAGIETVAALEIVGVTGRVSAFDRLVLDHVTRVLGKMGKSRVVERQRIDRVREEIKLNLADVIDQKKAVEAGRLLGADGLLAGTSYERDEEIEVMLRMIASRTGQVVTTASLRIAKDRSARQLLAQQVAHEGEGRRPPLQLGMFVAARRDRDERLVRDNDVLKSGEKFQVYVHANAECYVYIIVVEQKGRAQVLYPPEGRAPLKIQPGAWVTIPSRELWWYLDNRPGVETVYALASYEPLDVKGLAEQLRRGALGEDVKPSAGLEAGLYQEMILHQRSSRATDRGEAESSLPPVLVRGSSMKIRGVEGAVPGQAAAITLPEVLQASGMGQMVQGYTTVMSSVTYVHQ